MAIASVSASCETPSSITGRKGRPVRELMIWMTPTTSELRASRIGATSIWRVR
jgi:hypothetical protein